MTHRFEIDDHGHVVNIDAPREDPVSKERENLSAFCNFQQKKIAELEAENLHLINQRTIFEAANTKLANDERITRNKCNDLEAERDALQARIDKAICNMEKEFHSSVIYSYKNILTGKES